MSSKKLRIKFLSNLHPSAWLHQFPDNEPVIKNCEFTFDVDTTEYDWLIVYDDLPKQGRAASVYTEKLQCNPENTLLVTQEPSSVKYYGSGFTTQFGHVLTSQPEYALPHKNRYYSQPALFWFYGIGKDKVTPYNQIAGLTPEKTRDLSVVWSNKKQVHTNHFQRLKFLNFIKKEINGLSVFGRDGIPLDDKADALDKYRYHIAIENHFALHHWTEKLADSFLGMSLPFYYGCPNLEEYFIPDSYIRIDINEPEKSLEIILNAIKNNEYEKRKEAITDSKRRVMEEYNLFVVLSTIINEHHKRERSESSSELKSRRRANTGSLFAVLHYLINKLRFRIYYIFRNLYNKAWRYINE